MADLLSIVHQSSCWYSVVLVGHSLGGLIGKALFTLPGFPAAQVSFIITSLLFCRVGFWPPDSLQVSMLLTLATPHTPVVLFDKQTHDFYTRCTEMEESGFTFGREIKQHTFSCFASTMISSSAFSLQGWLLLGRAQKREPAARHTGQCWRWSERPPGLTMKSKHKSIGMRST